MLNDTVFKASMDTLQSYYGKQLDRTQLDIWFSRFSTVNAVDFKQGINRCIDNERYFPTPMKLMEHVDEIQTNRRKQAVHEENQAAKAFLRPQKKYGSKYLQEVRELFHKVLDKEIESFDLADAMFEMDKKYPGLGWAEEAKGVLHDFNKRKGIKTDPELMPKQNNKIKGIIPEHLRCTHIDSRGLRCSRAGTLSSMIGENIPYYCSEHWSKV